MKAMVGSRGAQMRLANAHQHWAYLKSTTRDVSNSHVYQLVTPPRETKATGGGTGGCGDSVLSAMVTPPRAPPEQKRGQIMATTKGQQQHYQHKQRRNSPTVSPGRSPVAAQSGSPTLSNYAGAKFSTPPAPTALPKPPSRWTLVLGGQA